MGPWLGMGWLPYEGDGDLDSLDFCTRYHDRSWQCLESTLLGDHESFRGPPPGLKARVNRRRPPAIHFFNMFFDNNVVQRMVD